MNRISISHTIFPSHVERYKIVNLLFPISINLLKFFSLEELLYSIILRLHTHLRIC